MGCLMFSGFATTRCWIGRNSLNRLFVCHLLHLANVQAVSDALLGELAVIPSRQHC